MKMDYSMITRAVNSGEWKQARAAIDRCEGKEWDDTLAILKATVCFAEGENEQAYDAIRDGLACNCRNYELYLLLGNYYEHRNINQAWLCYENAEFFCDSKEDKEIIRQYKKRLEAMTEWTVQPLSIIILSYNLMGICRKCIESIRRNNGPSSYELIVVDNASTDGIAEWLATQEDIRLIRNNKNEGFPYGCNQGIEAAKRDNDIFLLNNDTVVFENSIFWLRMGLYEEERTGAVGSVSNYAAGQIIEEEYETEEEYAAYALTHNLPMRNPYESRAWLVGYAMLIKRRALDEVGNLDCLFSPGGFEDCDISVRLQHAGWRLNLCWNSFILHYGGGLGRNRKTWDGSRKQNQEKFRRKWNFDMQNHTWSRNELIAMITETRDKRIRVLEIGCGAGTTLAKIKFLWPNAQVSGIETSPEAVRIGANSMDIIQGNIETMELPYNRDFFDYIILGDVLECLYDPEAILKKLLPYLRKDGNFLCSVYNFMHESVILSLLKGELDFQETGPLQKENIRHYTLDGVLKLFYKCNLKIKNLTVGFKELQKTEAERAMLDAFYCIPGLTEEEQFSAYRYIFLAGRS